MAEDKSAAIRAIAEASLEAFIRLVHPGSVLGEVHRDLIFDWARPDAKTHSLVLLPRDHQKSRMAAYRAAWEITRNPAIRILYVSSTSTLAVKQVKFIKDILTSPIYQTYWPEMVHPDPGSREKWTEGEFSVDHPIRRQEAIRDATVFSAGLTTNIVGLHCDLAILDDIVTPENAYTETGRELVKTKYSLLASIEGTDAREVVVGTRYYPTDLYNEMLEAQVETFDQDGNITQSQSLYDLFERKVEDSPEGDGSGNFLWPRAQRTDGKWFGFNREVLAKKKAQYRDKLQFRAQYYNDPNDLENAPIKMEFFQYYDPLKLYMYEDRLTFNGQRLNVYAAMDFAYSLTKAADWTTIIVVGIDADQNILILDMDRFKTDLINEYFRHLLKMHEHWQFHKVRCEVTAAQKVIVKDLKENYIRSNGLLLTIDENAPNRHEGAKEERINAALQSRYANGQIWHPKGHNLTQVLEDELVQQHPTHDDLKDALAAVMDISTAPGRFTGSNLRRRNDVSNLFNSRFGGIL